MTSRERGSSPSLGSPGFEAQAQERPRHLGATAACGAGSRRAGCWCSGFLVWQLGTGPFLDGLRATSPWAVAGGARGDRRDDVVLRHALVAGLGAARWAERLPLRTAYVAYYRSQLINATLPGGVVGDVHRGRPARLARGGLGARSRPGGAGRRWSGRCCCPAPGAGSASRCSASAAVAGGAVLVLSALAVAGHLVVFLVAAQSVGVALDAAPARCRSGPWCCSARRSRSTSPAGGRARAWRPGRSRRSGRRPPSG